MSTLDLTLGALEIPILISSVLYGVTCLQAFLYTVTERSFGDPRWVQVMVGLVWLLETGHTVFTWILLYSYTVTNFGDPSVVFSTPWSLGYSYVFTAALGSIVQTFFAYRIYILTGRRIIPIISWCAAASRLATGTALAILTTSSHGILDFTARFSWLETAHLTVDVATDALITTSLCYHLLRHTAVSKPTRRVVHRLVLYTVETGLATSTCAVATIICSRVQASNLVGLGFVMIYPRLFANSLLAALNSRQGLRRMASADNSWSIGDVWDASVLQFRPDSDHQTMVSQLEHREDLMGHALQQEREALTVELEDMVPSRLSYVSAHSRFVTVITFSRAVLHFVSVLMGNGYET
ncbi:hypothetical protein JB92DRAFT_2815042 [Gautieria morchelliformis]|nr:hypothetical protein JB92DRAFT_2815042 [Gautieria morchelliformis]